MRLLTRTHVHMYLKRQRSISSIHETHIEKVMVCSCTARYPVHGTDCSKRFTLRPRQTCSSHRHLDFPGKHSATLQLLRGDFVYIAISVCSCTVSRYSFIRLSELEQGGLNGIGKASRPQRVDSNPGSLD